MTKDRITTGTFILSLIVHTGLLSSFSLSPPETEQEMVIEMVSIEIELPHPVEEVVIEEEEPSPIEPELLPPEPEPDLEPEPEPPPPEPESGPGPEPGLKATTPLPEVKDVFPQVKEVRKVVTRAQDVVSIPPVKVASRPHQFTETDERKKAREDFLILVRREIEQAKYYPKWARQRGLEGIVKVEFTISQEGKGGDIRIVESSGYKMLDEAALATIKRASPFSKLPEGLGERLKITIPIVYRLIEE
ncbi:MAG: energy transducer TonB [bacterium]|nr:energy transducer TonB [bacterium]